MSKTSQPKAIKVLDGLFLGDFKMEKDTPFLAFNQVTHIIHCAPQNELKREGLKYLYLNWRDNDSQMLFEDDTLQMIYDFIEKSVNHGESCLIICDSTLCRSVCAISSYLMKKFNWSLMKTLELLNQKKNDLHIKPSFFTQLTQLDYALKNEKRTQSWQECNPDPEEVVIKNTFMNSHNGPVDDIYLNRSRAKSYLEKKSHPKIRWADQNFPERCSSAPRSILKPKDLNVNHREVLRNSEKKTRIEGENKEEHINFQTFKTTVSSNLENLKKEYRRLPPRPERKNKNSNNENQDPNHKPRRYYSKYLVQNKENDENKKPMKKDEQRSRCSSQRAQSIDYEKIQGKGKVETQSFRVLRDSFIDNLQQTKQSIQTLMKKISEYQFQQKQNINNFELKNSRVFQNLHQKTQNWLIQERQKSVFNRKNNL